MHTLAKWLLLASITLFACALWQQTQLPERAKWQEVLQQDPKQTPTHRQPFNTTVNGVPYTIKPLYDYQLSGMVVSLHRADTWWDYLHQEWNDHLNISDVCVIFGNNAKNNAYQDFSFSSGQFTCNFKTRSNEAYALFDQTALSNNHLLSDKPDLIEEIRKVRVGDQIYFRGVLAEYAHQHDGRAFKRGSSTVRTDTGNGACETIYIDEFVILKAGGAPWHTLKWLAVLLFIIGSVMWYKAPFRA